MTILFHTEKRPYGRFSVYYRWLLGRKEVNLDSRLGVSALTNENAARCYIEGRLIFLAPIKVCLPVLDSESE
jgi:hypothetical protein